VIDRRSYKKEVFWRRVERIFGEASYQGTLLKRTGYQDVHRDDYGEVIYLGSGYWRCVPVYDTGTESVFLGIRLINPSRTDEEIDIVEKAFWLLP
jgi:hypothetical protein